MFIKLNPTATRPATWINFAQIRLAQITPNRQEIKLTFSNKTVMVLDAEDIPAIATALGQQSEPDSDPFDEIMTLSTQLLSDLSDPGTPGETIIQS